MKILFITRGSLVGSNNTGNTIINIFSGVEDVEYYNLYMRSERPNDSLCKISYQISEVSILKSLFNNKEPQTKTYQFQYKEKLTERSVEEEEKILYGRAKQVNSRLMWIVREWLWDLGTWKNESLNSFIEEIKPDLIFMPAYGCCYPYKILFYISTKLRNTPIFIYHVDDNYSLKQFSFSPFYWIYRFMLRKHIRNAETMSSKTYVISDLQKKEYDMAFNKKCSILTKGSNYCESNKNVWHDRDSIRLIYTGNIGDGRFDVLLKIGQALESIGKGELHIYSANVLVASMKKKMDCIKRIKFHGKISPEQIRSVQEEADILVHVESSKIKNRLAVRQSISTKIFDYLNIPRCILAIGPSGVASINFLIDNDAAVVVSNIKDLESKLCQLITDEKQISDYSEKAWECGKKFFNINTIQEALKKDIDSVIK